jgi:prepilin-type N-terminal cleavage/methylation domain-containing protein
MKKRAAETLMEVVVAMTLFGIIMSGVFDFMANQAQTVSRNHDRNKLMYHVQRYVNMGKWADSEDKSLGVTFKYNAESGDGCISVYDNASEKNVMELYIDPPI